MNGRRTAGLYSRGAVFIALALLAFQDVQAATEYHPPLSSQLDTSQLPQDLIQGEADGGPPIEERIRVKRLLYQEIKNADGKDIGARIDLDLKIEQGFALKVPGLEDVLKLVFSEGEFSAELVLREEHAEIPGEDFPFILRFTPGENQVALRFAADVLKPVQPGNYRPYSGTAPAPELRLSAGIRVQVTYSWDGEPDVQLVDPGGLRPRLSLNTPAEIGDTGLVLEVEDAEVDFSRTSSPPGLAASWVGVKFQRLALNFVNGLDVPRVEHGEGAAPLPPEMAGVTVSDFSIGSGGVSGGICGNLSAGPTVPLFDTDFTLERMCITLQQGALTAGEVVGVLSEFPFFETALRLNLALSLDGNFKVGLESPNPADPTALAKLEIPSVLVFRVQALSVEKKRELFVWKTSGTLNINAISTTAEDAIKVNGLSISSDGEVALDGGWLALPEKKTIDFEGYAVELGEIGFGRERRDSSAQSWVGFTGGLELSQGIGASAKFKRLQYLWSDGASGVDVRLQSIGVAFRKPGVIAFEGALDFFDDPVTGDKGFAGAVKVNVEAVKLGIEGRLVIGEAQPPGQPSFPFFFVDLTANLPTGIPVFSNVSIYGFIGLFSYQMGPNVVAFTTPVQWFHAHLAATNVLAGSPAPWRTESDAFAIGAGAIFGTTSDDGYIINAKIAVMVSAPGPVVMLQGAANIIKERTELTSTTSPTFTALAIFDGKQNTFLMNIGAAYNVINLIKVRGEAEGFFDLSNPNNWHMWIGKDQPEQRRIRAEVLGFLKASAYMMIDPASYRQGATSGYDARWKFGPLRVVLVALFGYDVSLFWRPVHVWGEIGVHGEFELSAFGIGIGLAANGDLEGQSPRPLEVEGEFKVKLKLPWPLPDPSARVPLRWEEQREKAALTELARTLAIEPRKSGPTVWPETTSLSGDSARGPLPASLARSALCSPGQSVPDPDSGDIRCNKPLVPVDVMAVAAFQREVNDVSDLGYGNPWDPASPKVDTVGSTGFQYDLDAFELVQAEKNGAVLNFDTPLIDLYAVWPAIAGGDDAAALYLKVLSRNPVDVYKHSRYLFYQNGTKGWTEWAVDNYGDEYCFDPEPQKKQPQDDIPSDAAPVVGTTVHVPPWRRCPIPPEMLTGVDFVLPPYSAFRFSVDTDVSRNTAGPDRIYRNYAIFHTEGPPLSLDPYVDMTTPVSERRPHYRGYDVGVRFSETYMDLMYRREGQLFQMQLLDDNDQPVRSLDEEVHIHTEWDLALTHAPRVTEDDWLQFLRDRGIPVDAVTPKDDRVWGRISLPAAIRGNERYKVRIWFEDERLASDTRLADADWLAANPVRFIEGSRVVVYEYPVLMSRFETFTELVETYAGNYIEISAAGASPATLAGLAAMAAGPVTALPANLDNTHAAELGQFLRHALSPDGPTDMTDPEIDRWIHRVPGYSGKPERMSETERRTLRESWSAALEAYDELEQALSLDTARRPLPERFETQLLVDGGQRIGWLLEAPEPIDFTRITPVVWSSGLGLVSPVIVPNRDNTRAFLLLVAGGAVQTWPDDVYLLAFLYRRTVSDRYPVLRHVDGAGYEIASVIVDLPGDRFEHEAP